jgi:hypothetical protein
MICYICHKHVTKSLKVDNVHFGYCDTHSHTVQLGVVKYMLKHTMDYLNEQKYAYAYSKKSSAEIEFKKQVLPEDLNELDD